MGRRSHEIPIDQGLELDTFRAIYVRYEQLCRQNGLVDFNELIIRTIELLKGHPNIRTDYQIDFDLNSLTNFRTPITFSMSGSPYYVDQKVTPLPLVMMINQSTVGEVLKLNS